jgi:hypothetical protein
LELSGVELNLQLYFKSFSLLLKPEIVFYKMNEVVPGLIYKEDIQHVPRRAQFTAGVAW